MKIANIKVAAVLGSGTMGAQLAACLANSGIKAYLYDLKDGDKLIAATAKTNLRKINPQPLQTAATSELVKACSYDEDLNLLQECDLIIEAVAENIDIKKSIFTKISPFIKSGTWIGTNTSGLSVNKISLSLPEELRSRFLGTHFFNPPRYLPLVEIIRTIHTQADIEPLINFVISILGKEVVLAPDSPNFIANRVGLFSLLLTTRNAIKFQIPFEVVDTLTGIPLARPKSATFRTADVVGLDILANAIKTSASVSHDPWHDINSIPSFMQKLIDDGSLGQKSGKGIYEKRQDGIYVLDLDTMAYRIATKKPPSSLLKLLAREDKYEVLNTLCKSKEKHHQFLWLTIAELLHYCSWLCEDLAITTADLDNAIKLGFGWELGPFELWQQADVRKTAMLLESNINSGKHNVNIPLPNFVNLYNLFYKGNTSLAPRQGKFVAPTEFAASSRSSLRKILTSPSFEQKIIFETNETKLWTDKDEVFIFSIKTKLATINSKVLNDFMKAIETAEANNIPLVIWHEHGKNFGAGANLKDIGKQYMLGGGKAIGKVIAQFQNTVMRLKYANIPTIAAVQGLCLGGSCEIMLHCKHRVVTFNSYIGLVEAGVGLIPAAGGSKEMALKAINSINPKEQLAKNFRTIAMGKLATSANMALELGFLNPSDTIIANPNEILHVSKAYAKALKESCYRAPTQKKVAMPGEQAIANLQLEITNIAAGGFASEHDCLIAKKIAEVMCGGYLNPATEVSEQYLLNLEKEKFLELLATWKTKKRIAHMLKTNKRLAN